MILRGIGVAQGNVADDTEGDERYVIRVAGLGNGARLHVDRPCLGEVTDDLAHLLLRVYKPVAGDDEAGLDGEGGLAFGQRFCHAEHPLVGGEAGRHALHLAVLRAVVDGTSAIDVVINKFRTGNDILHAEVVAVAAGAAAGDDGVGLVLANHLGRADGRVHLADAALHNHKPRVVAENLLQRAQFLLHSNNDSYLHNGQELIRNGFTNG